jgi:hypothetical protein
MSAGIRKQLKLIAACGFDEKLKEKIETMVVTSDQTIEASGVPPRVQNLVKHLMKMKTLDFMRLPDRQELGRFHHCHPDHLSALTCVGAMGLLCGLTRSEAFSGPPDRTDGMIPGENFSRLKAQAERSKSRSRSKSPSASRSHSHSHSRSGSDSPHRILTELCSMRAELKKMKDEMYDAKVRIDDLEQALKDAKEALKDAKEAQGEEESRAELQAKVVKTVEEEFLGCKAASLDESTS